MSSVFEKQDWDSLVDILREEIQEYGGLFNLLDRQQDEIFQRDPEAVLKTNEEIEACMEGMGGLRERREEKVRQMAALCGCDSSLSLKQMLPFFPEFVRPMMEALVDEINQMVRRTRRKARQNFLLLSRTMELAQETLRALQPDSCSKTYTRKGSVGVNGKLPSRYRAFV